MKKIILMLFTALLFCNFSGCKEDELEKEDELKINNETPDISVCGVNDPLQNIEWLRKYCESLNETQDFSSVHIYLYKIMNTDEHVFKISIAYSDFEVSPFISSETWRNCVGELIFETNSGVPPAPGLVENFLKDKEYIAELFCFIKQ